MKKIISFFAVSVAITILLYACSKNTGITNTPYSTYGQASSGTGQLKINLAFAYTVDYATIMIKINGQTVGSALQTRTPYPGGGYNTRGSNYALYLAVPKGNDTVQISLPKVGTNVDSVVFYSTIINIPDSANYTLHIADTLTKTKSVLVKNNIAAVDTGKCRFKFVNLIPNVTSVDLYLNGVLMKSGLAYLQSSDTTISTGFNAPGYNPLVTTTWAVRATGTSATSTAIASYASSNGLQSTAVLTLYTMGYNGSTGTRLPYLAFTLDKNQ
jgi:hypothetical protein